MIYFDTTESSRWRHRSGLARVGSRLREALAAERPGGVVAWRWPAPGPSAAEDWLVTPELFSEDERPGFTAFLGARTGRRAAIYHDSIPLKFPHITWPASVARHPGYLKLLSRFDRVWAVSAASRDELRGFWAWQGVVDPPPVDVLPLGADFDGRPRAVPRPPPGASTGAVAGAGGAAAAPPRLLAVGILEPRKNQDFLLGVCEELWDEGLAFELDLVGRVNPHFGRSIKARIDAAAARRPGLRHHARAGDELMGRLYAGARASVLPTLAEGCGLPLLESLWQGVPCVGSDLPPLRENAAGGGCLLAPVSDRLAWKMALRQVLADPALHARLGGEAAARPLPTWQGAAQVIVRGLESSGR